MASDWPLRPQGAISGDQSQSPEQAQKRIESRQMGVGKHPRHRQERKPCRRARRRTPAPAGHQRDQAHKRGKRECRGQPAGEDVVSRRVRPLPQHLDRLAQLRGDSEQPPTQGRMLGVVAKNPIDDRAIEEMPSLFAQDVDIRPARPNIQRLVNCEPRAIEREDDRQTCERFPSPEQGGRSKGLWLARALTRALAKISSRNHLD